MDMDIINIHGRYSGFKTQKHLQNSRVYQYNNTNRHITWEQILKISSLL